MLGQVSQIYSNTLLLGNLFEFLNLTPTIIAPILIASAQPKIPQAPTSEIRFRDVSFRYLGSDRWIFKDFNLTIPAGKVIAIVVAIGKQALSGEATSKSNVARYLKDFFQSLAVFMPCFMSQSPAGIQLYLIASFIFTYFQGQALRNDSFRGMVGLPLRQGPSSKPEAKYASEFIELKRLEQKAIDARGDGPVLGKGVLAAGLEASFAGSSRPSSIKGSGIEPILETIHTKPPHANVAPPIPVGNAPFIHGISAPPGLFDSNRTRFSQQHDEARANSQHSILMEPSELNIERANRGQAPIQMVRLDEHPTDKPLNVERFRKSGKVNSKRKKR